MKPMQKEQQIANRRQENKDKPVFSAESNMFTAWDKINFCLEEEIFRFTTQSL